MKNSIYLLLFLNLLFFACQKNEPEIAGIDELSAISYSEKIFTQPIQIDNQIIAVVNDGSSTFLTSYGTDGNKIWNNSIDEYIIPGNNFQEIEYMEIKLSPSGEIVLNMLDSAQNHKTVKFSSSGDYINEFSDVIHQTDTIFIGTDTIDLNGFSRFSAKGLFSLTNNNNIVVSSYAPRFFESDLIDSTFIQLSFYNNNGQFLEDRYIIIDAPLYIKKVFISSDDDLIFVAENLNGDIFIFITDLQGNLIGVNNDFQILNLYSFFENSNGEFIFTASTFNNFDYGGLIFSINRQGQGLWDETYTNNTAWIFMSVVELNDGYIFTGFNIKKILIDVDWRYTFDIEKNVEAVVLKTDFLGEMTWHSVLQSIGSTIGATTLIDENLIFFGGKYDGPAQNNTIQNIIILKLDKEGEGYKFKQEF